MAISRAGRNETPRITGPEGGIARRIRKVAERKSGVIRLAVTFDRSIISGAWLVVIPRRVQTLFAIVGSGSRPSSIDEQASR